MYKQLKKEFEEYKSQYPATKRFVEPEVPNALPHARFGLNLMLLVMYLRLVI